MTSKQELASDLNLGKLKKQFKYALLPTKLNSGKWIWLTHYFNLFYMVRSSKGNEDYLKAKVSLMEMVEIHHIATQGSPESKGTGGGIYEPTRNRNNDRPRRYSHDDEYQYTEYTSNYEMPKSSGIPDTAQPKDYGQMKTSILENIIGQDEIIEEMMKKIVRRDFKLSTDKKKPLSFFWAGPTGVGKTETALQLGKATKMPVIRIDMSEYTHDHNIARLIGSPPGYVGFNQPGILQECDGRACIILVDEIEKAHSLVYNIFLQVMDYGVLTDGRNRQVDLTNAIIIMTSNVGAREMNETKIGISNQNSPTEKKVTVMNAMKKTFSPEFINRLSAVLVFNSLEFSVIENIVKMNVNKVLKAVENEHGVNVELSDEIKSQLLQKAYDPLMGVRPIHRAIESLLLEPLSHQIMNEQKKGKIRL